MIQKIRQVLKKQEGQGMTEYIILAALIAVAAIGIMSIFGDTIREQFGRITSAMQGVNYKGTSSTRQIKKQTGHQDMSGYDTQTQND